MGKTSIQWTDFSINPFRARDIATGKVGHYCVKISGGCKFCYSARLQPRFGLHDFVAANRSKVELFLDESKLRDVLSRRIPTKYFWCDMTDMFLEDYPFEWIDKCFAVMALTPQHTHQILTKRPERMREYCSTQGRAVEIATAFIGHLMPKAPVWPLPNVWLGVSAEDQDNANARIPVLLDTPAAVRFVSYEPAIGPVDFKNYLPLIVTAACDMSAAALESGAKEELVREGLDWIIVGGESGQKARPFNINWARSIVRQCNSARVACFVKQIGAKPYACRQSDNGKPDHAGCIQEGLEDIQDSHGGNWDEWGDDIKVRQFALQAQSTLSST